MGFLLLLLPLVGLVAAQGMRPRSRANDPAPEDYLDEEKEALTKLHLAHSQHLIRMERLHEWQERNDR